jgi:pyridoxamine 5'-phosphate oxidase-like protein
MTAPEPEAARPFMPGYGTKEEATGMLPWSWAEERLTTSHDYWVATVWPDGRPHVTPVWGAWLDGALWFSCSPGSRKTRNLTANPNCTVTTDNALEPVILNGVAALVPARRAVEAFAAAVATKYEQDYSVEFFAANSLFRAEPATVVALTEADFSGSPTRWTF